MKKQKIFAISGLLLAVVFLAGCGNQVSQQTPAAVNTEKQPVTNNQDATGDSQKTLPATVSTKPGTNVDQEVNNITKDLNAASTDDMNTAGLSDKNLGL